MFRWYHLCRIVVSHTIIPWALKGKSGFPPLASLKNWSTLKGNMKTPTAGRDSLSRIQADKEDEMVRYSVKILNLRRTCESVRGWEEIEPNYGFFHEQNDELTGKSRLPTCEAREYSGTSAANGAGSGICGTWTPCFRVICRESST